MSHLALQRVMVRMLYDPTFTDRVLAGPEGALAGVGLTPEEISWLRGPDPRAWRADPERPVRSLDVLLQQYPASSALVVRSAGDARPLLEYFRSDRFHAALQGRGSMAMAYGDYLADLVRHGRVRDRRVLPLAGFEQAVVGLHRSIGPLPPRKGKGGAAYRLSPDKALHRAEAGTADLHEAILGLLAEAGADLARAVLDKPLSLPEAETRPGLEEPLLLELVRDDGPRVRYPVGAAEITEELYVLLKFTGEPRSPGDLAGEVTRLGAEPGEAPEIIEGLIADGTLVPVESTILVR